TEVEPRCFERDSVRNPNAGGDRRCEQDGRSERNAMPCEECRSDVHIAGVDRNADARTKIDSPAELPAQSGGCKVRATGAVREDRQLRPWFAERGKNRI